jgi:glucose-1-phosphatase
MDAREEPAVSRAPADALLFDLGGVVMGLDWDPMFRRWARACDRSAEDLRRLWVPDAAYERHERGEIGEHEYFEHLRGSLAADIDDDAFREGWAAIFTEPIHETVAMLERLRDRVPLYAFSNTNAAHQAVWSVKFADALANFRRVFTSSEMRLRKPHRAAFDHVAREIGVPHERILFFDDTLANVEGARAAGLQAVHVLRPEDVARAVRPWLDGD